MQGFLSVNIILESSTFTCKTCKFTDGGKSYKCSPLRPSENLDFLLFITVLRAYKAL